MVVEFLMKDRVRLKNKECYGLTVKKKGRFVVYISKTIENDMLQFALTLMHEFAHIWLFVLRSSGAKLDPRKDHVFIYKLEYQLVKLIKEVFLKKR